jgi:hypothetical protein
MVAFGEVGSNALVLYPLTIQKPSPYYSILIILIVTSSHQSPLESPPHLQERSSPN